MVIVTLTLWHSPIKFFAPQDTATIYANYFVPINITTFSELLKYFGLLPEIVTVLFDRVMVNRKSKVRWLLTSSYDFVYYCLHSLFQIFIDSVKGCYLNVL
jgi:hypothetical protein